MERWNYEPPMKPHGKHLAQLVLFEEGSLEKQIIKLLVIHIKKAWAAIMHHAACQDGSCKLSAVVHEGIFYQLRPNIHRHAIHVVQSVILQPEVPQRSIVLFRPFGMRLGPLQPLLSLCFFVP